MRSRVVTVDPAAEHGDGGAARFERAAVRLAVDPARETADHREPGRRKLAPEHPGDLRTVTRAGASADDRDGGLREKLGLGASAKEESRRRVADRPQ